MRLPYIPDALKNEDEPVIRDPSHPDRARIDSDVRALLRPASTPWIVFDRDSRVDDFATSALRVGAVFASSPTFRPSIVGLPEEKVTEDVSGSPEPALERDSSRATSQADVVDAIPVVVERNGISDSTFNAVTNDRPSFEPEVVLASEPSSRRSRRLAAVAAGTIGLLAIAAVSGVVVGAGARARAAARVSSLDVERNSAVKAPGVPGVEALVAEARIPIDDVATPAATLSVPSELPAANATKAKTDSKKHFGRLTIKADAKHKNVYFDGKRMLGSGPRSFTVVCGMHTIAVTDKADAKDVEIPCNGEYVVAK